MTERTRLEAEANELDLALFRVLSRLRTMQSYRHEHPAVVLGILLKVHEARRFARMMMHPEDLEKTSERDA